MFILTNLEVDPPIETVCEPARGLGKLGNNKFRDPEDEEYLQIESDWTPLELGLVFEWVLTLEGEIHIHMPYRIMDGIIHSSVRTLESFKSTEPWVKLHPNVQKNKRSAGSCLQDFILSQSDFKFFKTRLKKRAWVLRHGGVDTEELTTSLQELRNINKEIDLLKTSIKIGLIEASTEKELTAVDTLVERLEDEAIKSEQKQRIITNSLKKLRNEGRGVKEAEQAQVEYTIIKNDFTTLVGGEEKPVIKDFYRAVGEVRVVSLLKQKLDPESLTRDLNLLRAKYPSARYITSNGLNIEIRIMGVLITLGENEVTVNGDLGSLRTIQIEADSNNKAERSRFAGIIAPSEKE